MLETSAKVIPYSVQHTHVNFQLIYIIHCLLIRPIQINISSYSDHQRDKKRKREGGREGERERERERDGMLW